MSYNGAGSLFVNLMRITKLDAAGAPLIGANNMLYTTAMIRLEMQYEYEEGDEITQKNGAGIVCVAFKAPDTLKRLTIPRLQFCSPDPEALAMLVGGSTITGDPGVDEVQSIGLGAASAGTVTITFGGSTTTALAYNANNAAILAALEALPNIAPGDVAVSSGPWPAAVTLTFGGNYADGNVPQIAATPTGLTGGTVTIATSTPGASAETIGYAAPEVGTDPVPNGVSIEAWSRQVIGNEPVGYWHWVIPRAYMRTNDAIALSGTDPTLADLAGFGLENSSWGDGPVGDWAFTSDRVLQYAQVSALPVFTPGLQAVVAAT